MATIHHQPYHHSTTSHHRSRRHSFSSSLSSLSLPSSSPSTSLTLKPSTTTTTFAISSTTTTTPTTASDTAFSLDVLEQHLAASNFRLADDETRRLLIVLAGEAAIKRGYVFFSEVQFIPKEDLLAMDKLWRKYSDDKFGYSVQKKIWLKVNKDFTRFFMQVGWMKKLDTEIEQYNYRSFPSEFLWELNPSKNTDNSDTDSESNSKNSSDNIPPLGHLPLTNALRGTQLLNCIFNHPAFAEEGDNEGDEESGEQVVVEGKENKKKSGLESLRDRLFKPNYSF